MEEKDIFEFSVGNQAEEDSRNYDLKSNKEQDKKTN